MSPGPQISSHATSSVGLIALDEAASNLNAELLIGLRPFALGAAQPRVKSRSRHPEQPAHHAHGPQMSVAGHDRKLYFGSFAKSPMVYPWVLSARGFFM